MTNETAAGGNAAENTYHEEKFESKCFASLSDEDFQKRNKRENPQTRPGPQTLQFAHLEHF